MISEQFLHIRQEIILGNVILRGFLNQAKEAFAGSDEPDDFNKLVEGLQFRMPDQNVTQV